MNINDIFELANKNYNLKLIPNTPENIKEINAIKKKIRRTLQKNQTPQPYKLTTKQANRLVNEELFTYLSKKSTEKNPLSKNDFIEKFIVKNNLPKQQLSYDSLLISKKLDYIIKLLQELTDRKETFANWELESDYHTLLTLIDKKGVPKPGYAKIKNKINQSSYFINLNSLDNHETTEKRNNETT